MADTCLYCYLVSCTMKPYAERANNLNFKQGNWIAGWSLSMKYVYCYLVSIHNDTSWWDCKQLQMLLLLSSYELLNQIPWQTVVCCLLRQRLHGVDLRFCFVPKFQFKVRFWFTCWCPSVHMADRTETWVGLKFCAVWQAETKFVGRFNT